MLLCVSFSNHASVFLVFHPCPSVVVSVSGCVSCNGGLCHFILKPGLYFLLEEQGELK